MQQHGGFHIIKYNDIVLFIYLANIVCFMPVLSLGTCGGKQDR